MEKRMDRRTFLMGGAVAAGMAATAGLTACAPSSTEGASLGATGAEPAAALPSGLYPEDFELSPVLMEPVGEFSEEETYDIVVVGAGCAGVPAVLTALEEGATVCCLQKEPVVAANGKGASAVVVGSSTEAGIKRWMCDWARTNDWRMNMDLFRFYVDHSEETLSWVTQQSLAVGIEPMMYQTGETICYDDGNVVALFKIMQDSNNALMTALAEKAEASGAVFHYATPAVQLIKDDTGRVSGVVGARDDGTYVKVNASKAVILAAGDYSTNPSLLSRYCQDMINFQPDQVNRTGDGHLLGVLAGGSIVPANHARQVHCMYATQSMYLTTPFLMLDDEGQRFMNEEAVMTSWNTLVKYRHRKTGERPVIYRFFDSAVMEKYPDGDGTLERLNGIIEQNGMEMGADGMLARADTLDELFEILGVPAAEFKASIERYNELCAAARDDDFGKRPEFMKAIDTPPYYGVMNTLNFAAVNGGLTVNNCYQVVDDDCNPIPGLYAAGTDAGDVCGGINWSMPGGSSNCHCFTAGRYTVLHALTGRFEPSHPCSWKDIADKLAGPDGKPTWEALERASEEIKVW